jgi:hypothetical protein
MTDEELRILTLERENKAFNLLVSVARSDPSTSGFNTVQAYRNAILQEHSRVLLFLSDHLQDE